MPRHALSLMLAALLGAVAPGCEQRSAPDRPAASTPSASQSGAAQEREGPPPDSRTPHTRPHDAQSQDAQTRNPTSAPPNGNTAMPIAPGRFAAKELFQLARMNASGAVPDESRQSLPIPIRTREGMRVQFIFFAAVPRPNVQMLGVPQYLATLDPRNGALELLRKVTPSDFGQSHDPAQPIGPFSLPQGVTLEEFNRDLERLFAVYDELLPAFADSRASGTVDAKLRAEFVRLFGRVFEPPLAPYYKSAGAEFFNWVGVTFP